MVISIHLYGFIKKKFNPQAKMAENTIVTLDFVPNEQFSTLLQRLKLDQEELGDCFVNSKVANEKTLIPDNARIALFSKGMRLLCGGQHIKGHGFVTKPSPVPLNTWNT